MRGVGWGWGRTGAGQGEGIILTSMAWLIMGVANNAPLSTTFLCLLLETSPCAVQQAHSQTALWKCLHALSLLLLRFENKGHYINLFKIVLMACLCLHVCVCMCVCIMFYYYYVQ